MSARVLEIEGQFLYIPGCMIISFDDSRTHTTEVKIVRTNQAIDLGKLREVHEIYKETLHDMIGVAEAMERLETVLIREQRYNRWILVGVYGLASACVGPFAFQARPIDLPVAFFLGCCLGFMQLILAPKSELYSNIFEVTAAVLTSFLARAFGSIRGGDLFCFSALAQSSIALILPGYTVRKFTMHTPTTSQTKLTDNSVRCTGIAVSEYSRRLRSHGVRHHLFSFPRLWHHDRNVLLWRNRLSCHIRDQLQVDDSGVVPVHLRPALYAVSHCDQSRQMETNAVDGHHRIHGLRGQQIFGHTIRLQRANRQHARCSSGRGHGKPVQSNSTWGRSCRSPPGHIRPSTVRVGSKWKLGQRCDERKSDQ